MAASKPRPVMLMVRELGIGGCERDVTKIATNLDRSRFEAHVGCFYAQGLRYAELQDAGIPIAEFTVRSFRSPSLLRAMNQFRGYVRKHGIQLVHTYDVPTTSFAIPTARLCRVRGVVSSQLGYRDLFSGLEQKLLRATDRMADRIVVNCEAMRRHMIDDERVSPDLPYLCYNGVDTKVFFPRQEPKPLTLKDASVVVGIVCALRPEKRIDLLMSAFARVQHLQAGLKLLIVGSGPLLESLQSHAASLGILDACVFQPATSDVAPWMRAMDIFVLPSDSEAFSNALLESMASGCCPVGSRVGGTPEQIEHGRTGLLFERSNVEDLAAQLTALLNDPSRRRTMAEAAAESARTKFSIERAATTTGALYTSLLEKA